MLFINLCVMRVQCMQEMDQLESPVVSDPRMKRRREQKLAEEDESRRIKRPKQEFTEDEVSDFFQ